MNTVTFTIGLDRGRHLQEQLESFPGKKDNWEFEVTDDQWLNVKIIDMSSLDALMIFHAGVDAGVAMGQKAIKHILNK